MSLATGMNEKPHSSATNLFKQILYSLLKFILFSFEDESTITAVEATYFVSGNAFLCICASLSPHAHPHALLQPIKEISKNVTNQGILPFCTIQRCGGNACTSFCILHCHWAADKMMTVSLAPAELAFIVGPLESMKPWQFTPAIDLLPDL